MKKIIGLYITCILLYSPVKAYWVQTDFGNESLQWLYSQGLTKYDTDAGFRSYDTITREQAAKFFSQYASQIEKKALDENKICDFTDIGNADTTLKNEIITSCKLGIFQGTKGQFLPKKEITLVEAVAVLMRIKYGKMDETIQPNRYENYLAQAKIDDLVPSITIKSTTQATRGIIGKMIYLAANPDKKVQFHLAYKLQDEGFLGTVLRGFPEPSSKVVTFENKNSTKPLPNNNSDIHITVNANGFTPMENALIQINNNDAGYNNGNAFDVNSIILTGKVTNNVERIEMVYDGDMSTHIIEGFKPGDTDFSITVSAQTNTLRNGYNRYFFRAYAKGKIYYYIVNISLYQKDTLLHDEKISTSSSINSIKEKENACYDSKGDTEQINCLSAIIKKYTYSKAFACSLSDGHHDGYVSVNWPGKSAQSQGFFKHGGKIYYVIKAATMEGQYDPRSFPSCEYDDYEEAIYSYNCNTTTIEEISASSNSKDGRFHSCGKSIIFGNDNYILYNQYGYEGPGAIVLLNRLTNNKSLVSPLSKPYKLEGFSDDLFAFDGYLTFLSKAQSIEKHYFGRESYGGMFGGIDFSLENCTDDLKCILHYNIAQTNSYDIFYDGTIDLINKTILSQ